jgi:hypothetical protein
MKTLLLKRLIILIIFSHRDYGYFWIPILGPHIGAIIGCVFYLLLVGLHWPPEYEVTGDIGMSDKEENKNREFKGKTFRRTRVLFEGDGYMYSNDNELWFNKAINALDLKKPYF